MLSAFETLLRDGVFDDQKDKGDQSTSIIFDGILDEESNLIKFFYQEESDGTDGVDKEEKDWCKELDAVVTGLKKTERDLDSTLKRISKHIGSINSTDFESMSKMYGIHNMYINSKISLSKTILDARKSKHKVVLDRRKAIHQITGKAGGLNVDRPSKAEIGVSVLNGSTGSTIDQGSLSEAPTYYDEPELIETVATKEVVNESPSRVEAQPETPQEAPKKINRQGLGAKPVETVAPKAEPKKEERQNAPVNISGDAKADGYDLSDDDYDKPTNMNPARDIQYDRVAKRMYAQDKKFDTIMCYCDESGLYWKMYQDDDGEIVPYEICPNDSPKLYTDVEQIGSGRNMLIKDTRSGQAFDVKYVHYSKMPNKFINDWRDLGAEI